MPFFYNKTVKFIERVQIFIGKFHIMTSATRSQNQ